MRFQNPAPGIWNIYVSDDGVGNREFDLWLPITNFISEDTFFLESTPYNTLVAPSNTGLLISCGSYNSNTGSLAIDSSRGFPRNAVKPDFTAPGVRNSRTINQGNAMAENRERAFQEQLPRV